jgi:hypothetical protein
MALGQANVCVIFDKNQQKKAAEFTCCTLWKLTIDKIFFANKICCVS